MLEQKSSNNYQFIKLQIFYIIIKQNQSIQFLFDLCVFIGSQKGESLYKSSNKSGNISDNLSSILEKQSQGKKQ